MITQDDVVYMIVTDRFADGDADNNGAIDISDPNARHGGDLLGIVQRLPYLTDLGVTALWITPVYVNPPQAYHGYHPLDFEKVDPHLCSRDLGDDGGRSVVCRFVEAAHAHGMKVIFDAIVCHTASGHPWLKERPDWFNTNSSDPVKWWIWGLPDLNHDNLDVNLYFAENVLRWMQSTGVDGLRIDAARHVETGFWHIFKLFSKGPYCGVTLIGEVWDAAVDQVAPFQMQHGFDSMFDYPLYHAIVDVFVRDASFGRIARPEISENEPWGILNMDVAYRNAYHLITFFDNHDTARFFEIAGGNQRQSEAVSRMKLAMTFLFTTRGIPQLYYGTELAMDGGEPPDNRQDMPWSLIDSPDAGMVMDPPCDMRHFTRSLVALRRSSPALRYGLLVTLYVTDSVYAFARIFIDDIRIVVLNNSGDEVGAVIPVCENPRLSHLTRSRLADRANLVDDLHPGCSAQILEGHLSVRLPARTGGVYRLLTTEMEALPI